MDRETEKFVIQALKKIKHETAILLVSHKFQTALESDMVYLLEGGEIADSGAPKELLERENFLSNNYKELVFRSKV